LAGSFFSFRRIKKHSVVIDLLKKVSMFEVIAVGKPSVKEVIFAQKEAMQAAEKARKLLEALQKAGK
jgi:hypothetical protein